MPKTTRTNPRYMVSQPHAPSKKPKRAGKRTVKGGKDKKSQPGARLRRKKPMNAEGAPKSSGATLCSARNAASMSTLPALDSTIPKKHRRTSNA
mmetsp:Transcript_16181/g.31617  ORF Transcript_16181/g.31617 Transcript_16181/m.31617 type:complete len:94 (+) Transcript_16181:101-382(+)